VDGYTLAIGDFIAEVVQIGGSEAECDICYVDQRSYGIEHPIPSVSGQRRLYVIEGQNKGDEKA